MQRIAALIFCFFSFSFNTLFPETKPCIAVFCSADDKVSYHYKKQAVELGKKLASHEFGLITGGSCTGLMKEVIDGYVCAASSLDTLWGNLPRILEPFNVHHPRIPKDNILWSETIHERLKLFHDIANAVIILPGGFGTLHELTDFLVHNQFGLLKTPIVLLNINHFWNPLLAQFQVMYEQQLLTQKHLDLLICVNSIDECMNVLAHRLQNAECEHQGLTSLYWQK